MASIFRKSMRGMLIALEQEPVVAFSVGLSAFALALAVVVPPIRHSMGLKTVNYDTGAPVVVVDEAKKD